MSDDPAAVASRLLQSADRVPSGLVYRLVARIRELEERLPADVARPCPRCGAAAVPEQRMGRPRKYCIPCSPRRRVEGADTK